MLIPDTYNYIGCFLTWRCNMNCHYCLNKISNDRPKCNELSLVDWVDGLRKIRTRQGLPITMQGGEPTLYKELPAIAKLIANAELDLLTNAQFDLIWFENSFTTSAFKRIKPAPYASIRVSYHPRYTNHFILLNKVKHLLDKGYSVGIWAVNHPSTKDDIMQVQEQASSLGIDFRLKEYLGWCDGKWYGTLKYEDACIGSVTKKQVKCKTTELLIGPNGNIYRCHSDLYNNRTPIGNILRTPKIEDIYRDCENYGTCNPCDIKVKTNRFQEYGHTSVDIKFE